MKVLAPCTIFLKKHGVEEVGRGIGLDEQATGVPWQAQCSSLKCDHMMSPFVFPNLQISPTSGKGFKTQQDFHLPHIHTGGQFSQKKAGLTVSQTHANRRL